MAIFVQKTLFSGRSVTVEACRGEEVQELNQRAKRALCRQHSHQQQVIYDPGSAVPPPPSPPQWFLPTPPPPLCGVVVGCFPPPLWCGVVWLWVASPLPVVWCGSGVGFGGSPPSPPVAWCGLGGSPLHVWICLGCLANPCS